MGQKSNVTTIRKSQFQFLTHETKSKQTVHLVILLKYLQFLFYKCNIFLVKSTIQIQANKIYINFVLFFRTRYLLKLKKKIKKQNRTARNSRSIFKILNLISDCSIFILSTKIINSDLRKNNKLSKALLANFFKSCNRYSKMLFPRRLNFFLDFLKLSTLLFRNKIKIAFFLRMLSETLSVLQKKRHTLYLQFIKFFFLLLLKPEKKIVKLLSDVELNTLIVGIKFNIAGKLKGKQRASSSCLILGNIPIQTLKSDIQFAKIDTFTVYGIFGLKLWINRKN